MIICLSYLDYLSSLFDHVFKLFYFYLWSTFLFNVCFFIFLCSYILGYLYLGLRFLLILPNLTMRLISYLFKLSNFIMTLISYLFMLSLVFYLLIHKKLAFFFYDVYIAKIS